MNTYFDTYRPIHRAPIGVKIVRGFTPEDFDLGGKVHIGGAKEAWETYTKNKPQGTAKRYVAGSRVVEWKPEVLDTIVEELAELWSWGSNRKGTEKVRSWDRNDRHHMMPGFDELYAQMRLSGPYIRSDLTSRSTHDSVRQAEIDDFRGTAYVMMTSPQVLQNWIDDLNEKFAQWATHTWSESVSYTAEFIRDVRVNDEYFQSDNLSVGALTKLDNLDNNIQTLTSQIQELQNQRVKLREDLYDLKRQALEQDLKTTNHPLGDPLFKEAIDQAHDMGRPSQRSVWE